jgi:hypothetical protein
MRDDRDDAAGRRFGVEDAKQGVVYTRTSRILFAEGALEWALIERRPWSFALRRLVPRSNWWS